RHVGDREPGGGLGDRVGRRPLGVPFALHHQRSADPAGRRDRRPPAGGTARAGRSAMTAVRADAPVSLVRGDDDVILRNATRELIHRLLGDLDAGLAVDEIGGDRFQPSDGSEPSIAPLVQAAQTPPFLTDRRVVVGRDLDIFTRAEQVAPLVAYLEDPLPTTSLVLVWAQGRVPRSVTEAVKACGGEQVDTSPGRKVEAWVAD